MNLQPLEDRIVVRPSESEETTAPGLVIPDTAKEKPQQGEGLAVGPGRRAENTGDLAPTEVELDDPFENMGAQLVKEVATKTNDVAGDGTTTATVLAQALVREGLRNVAAGANPMDLKRGIERAVSSVVESIKAQAKEIDDR